MLILCRHKFPFLCTLSNYIAIFVEHLLEKDVFTSRGDKGVEETVVEIIWNLIKKKRVSREWRF